MKKLILLLIIYGFLYPLYGQSLLIYKCQTIREEIPFCIKQIGASYFLGLRSGPVQWSNWHDTRLLKLKSNGELQSELTFVAEDSNYFDIHCIVPLNESEFLTIGGCKQKNMPNAQLWIMKLDTLLNILWDRRYFTNRKGTNNVTAIQKANGNYIIGASLSDGSPLWQFSLLFFEITGNGDSIQAKYYTNGNPINTDIQSIIEMNGQYKAFVTGFQSFVPPNCFSEILQLGADLNLIEVRSAPYLIEGSRTAEKISDYKYYLTGMSYSPATYYDVAIAKLSNTEAKLHYNHAGKPGDAVDYSGWMKCMAIANSNSIYTGGTGNDNGIFYNCPVTNKVLMLSNYDSLLNCRWTRFYGSNDACYTLSTMDATSDGGCVIAGMFYTPSNPDNLLDVIVIKVDSTGLLTNLTEKQLVTSHEAIIYPNPGQNYITVQSGPQISRAIFRLYDATGNLVKETTLNSTIEKIDATQLSYGIYPWQIINKGKIVDKGKWIKQ